VHPDLVLVANITPQEQVKAMEDLGLTVFMLPNPTDLNGMYESLRTAAKLTGHETETDALIASLQVRVKAVETKLATVTERPLVFYEIDGTDVSRLKDDVALALVLSVFFGLGVCLIVAIQQLPTGNAAGLDHMIYGKAAAMSSGDTKLILGAGLAVALICIALFKEFRLLCFDENFAAVQGWPRVLLDLMLMSLVVAVTVIGLQAVGLLLSVALLIVPAAAARFWSESLGKTAWIAAAIGLVSGWGGVLASALFPKLPAGAMIVLVACSVFAFSMLFGVRRGVWVRWREHRRVKQRVGHQHLMRACYELLESRANGQGSPGGFLGAGQIGFNELLRHESWSHHALNGLLRVSQAAGFVATEGQNQFRLTASGRAEARRVVRNHRLWELYLIEHADVAPSHVHHDADEIEHVVDANIVARLEEMLSAGVAGTVVPMNPELSAPGGARS
jgi:manganese/zinc/iron transport system permease protein